MTQNPLLLTALLVTLAGACVANWYGALGLGLGWLSLTGLMLGAMLLL